MSPHNKSIGLDATMSRSLRLPMADRMPAGTVIGDQFQIIDVLGQGGMGVIYRVIQLTTGAERALKIIHPELLRSERNRQRFLQEARVSSRIRSDHVAQVIAAGIDKDSHMPWLAMELLDGLDLAKHLEQVGVVGGLEAASIATQIGHALGAAHDEGIVHRDLKPDNIFLARSQLVGMPFVVKLLDFGIAKLITETPEHTAAMGTPLFMAPEQSNYNARVSPATDVWAFGLLMFRMLVGKCFWRVANQQGHSLAALWREILLDPIPRASLRAAEYGRLDGIPPEFDDWLLRCLERDPDKRLADVREAAGSLAQILAPRAPTWHPITPTTHSLGPPGTLVRSAPRLRTKVTYQSRGERIVVDAEPGMTLLDVSRTSQLPHTSVCGGQARCTTCRVLVLDGVDHLSPRTGAEQLVADRKRWPKNIRLACQARIMGSVTVRRLVVDKSVERMGPGQSPPPMNIESILAGLLVINVIGLQPFTDTAMPFDVAHVMNRVLSEMAEPIEQNGGRIARATGLQAIAIFPQNLPDGATAALRAALRIKSRISVLNEELIKHFDVSLRVRMGLHHGDIIVGDIGHPAANSGEIFGSGVTDAQAAAYAAARRELAIVATDGFCAAMADSITTGARVTNARRGTTGELFEIVDFRTPDGVYLVQSTFERVAARPEEFSSMFYNRLFETYPEVKLLFAEVDMSVQRAMLMQAIESVVRAMHNMDSIRDIVRDLGRRHVAYGTKLIHYKYVGEALIWTLEQFFGDEFVPELYVAWMETYGQIARLMIEGGMEEPG